MQLSLTSILFILIIFQLLFLSAFLFTQKKGNRISQWLLGSFFLCLALNLLDVFLLMNRATFSYPDLAGWGSCIPLLFGPLLYLYTRSMLEKGFSFTPGKWLHFIPFVLFFLLTEAFYISQSRETKERLLQNAFAHHFHWSVSIASSLIFLQFALYIAFSLDLIAQQKKVAPQHFSHPRQTNLSWLYTMLLFFTTLMIGTTLNGILTGTPLAKYYLLTFSLIILVLLVFINRVLLRALRTPYFFSFEVDPGPSAELSPEPLPEPSPEIRENTENALIAQRLRQFMQDEKPWLEPELSLDQLSRRLSLKPKLLSTVINEQLSQNFFDFINHYRIDEAKRLLTNPVDKKTTVLEVLYQVGFNSKSSFNTLFKKYTGLTPTEFRKKQMG